jgi:predicted ATP-grasp superfamily ATP-dependent carboligase
MDALVADAHLRAVVAGLRGLGAAGIRATALAPRRSAAGLWSRHASGRAVAPDPRSDAPGFVARVREQALEHGPVVVYPGCEDSIEALVAGWDELPPRAVLPFPSAEIMRVIRDKRRLPELAADAGLRAPSTLAEAMAGDLDGAALRYPCIVKPGTPAGRLKTARLVRSADDLRRELARRHVAAHEPLLVQERLEGPLLSLELVLDRRGQVVACFQQEASRTWPVAAGSIAAARSVAPDADLLARAAGMLATAGYWGLAQLDFVVTPDAPVLVDVNTRFYSCLPLALRCGVNLPAAWHAVTLDEPVECPEDYPTGVTFRWLEGDLAATARGVPGRLFARGSRPRVGSMWAATDPLPGLLLGIGMFGSRLRRGRG